MDLSTLMTDSSKRFLCSYCGTSFAANNSLRKHCREKHRNLQQPGCLRSGRKAQTFPGLPDGQSRVEFQCPVCNKNYYRKHSLQRHQKFKHMKLPAESERIGNCSGQAMQDGSAVKKIISYETCKTIGAFQVSLHEHEISMHTKFVCVRSPHSFLDRAYKVSSSIRIRWNGTIPYILLSSRLYDCHQGKDRNVGRKRKYAECRKLQQDAGHGLVRCRNAQPTKKLHCPARFCLLHVISFEKYKVTETENQDEKRRKTAAALKRALLQQLEHSGEECFLFRFPSLSDHKFHNMGIASSLTQGLDYRVRAKIKEIYSRNRCSITDVQTLVEEFVTVDLGMTNRMDRRFFPERTMVRSVVHSVKMCERFHPHQKLASLLHNPALVADTEAVGTAASCDDSVSEGNAVVHGNQLLSASTSDSHSVAVASHNVISETTLNRESLLNVCLSDLNSMQSYLWLLPVDQLSKYVTEIANLANSMKAHVPHDSSGLALSTQVEEVVQSSGSTTQKSFGRLSLPHKNKNRGLGIEADSNATKPNTDSSCIVSDYEIEVSTSH